MSKYKAQKDGIYFNGQKLLPKGKMTFEEMETAAARLNKYELNDSEQKKTHPSTDQS